MMGLLPRKCPSMMAVSSAKPWRIVAADSERPNERRGWKPCPRFRSRNLGMSLMWLFLKYNVLSRSGQNGFARRCVAPRISELQSGRVSKTVSVDPHEMSPSARFSDLGNRARTIALLRPILLVLCSPSRLSCLLKIAWL